VEGYCGGDRAVVGVESVGARRSMKDRASFD
jgi:hypothetical protein